MKVRRLARSVAAAAGAIACIAAAAAQQPVRDNAPIVAGTASISGTCSSMARRNSRRDARA